MNSIWLKTVTITVASLVVSVALTAGVFLAIGAPGFWPAIMMAVVCPLLIAPPVSYYYCLQAFRTELLCGQLEAANAALEKASAQLRDVARRDGLTDLLNRNAFFEIASAEIRRQPGAMLMIDADHFKLINDVHGHASGDAALAMIGRAISTCCPEGAVAGRLGGEEFAILVPGMNGGDASALADCVRAAVAEGELAGEVVPFRVTVSIGIAAGEAGVSIDALYKAADLQLLQAKRSGRNRHRLMAEELAA